MESTRLTICCMTILLFTACESFQWTDTVENDNVVLACAGQDASLPWAFHLESGETIQDIKWNYRKGARDEEMVAMSVAGNFLPMPAFSQRVQQLTNAGILLSHVTVGSSGNYSVQVDVRDTANVVTGHMRNAYVDVADAFHVTQEPEAVYDTTTDSWHIALKCGMVANMKHSSGDVLWQTPSGDLSSTKYENGYFYLHLPNPVKGGNYTCFLPANVTATACVSTGAGLSPQSAIFVDRVEARLTLLEAENEGLRQRTSLLEVNNTVLQEKTSRTEARVSVLEVENRGLQQKTSKLENELNRYHETASKRVSFHASLSTKVQNVTGGIPVILNHVLTNEGGAYNKTNGTFTVPVSGTYVLFAAVGTNTTNRHAGFLLYVDNNMVCDTWSEVVIHYQSSSCQAVVHLVKGQRVWITADYDSYYYRSLTYFSGILVYPDA